MRASVIKKEESPESGSEDSNDSIRQELKLAKKRNLQVQYLENENTNLVLENEDLNTTLKINKDIIRTLLQGDAKFEGQVEFTFEKMNQEIQLLEQKVIKLQTDRDSLEANFLL